MTEDNIIIYILKIKNLINRMRLAGHVARIGDRFAYRILVARPERKRQLGRQKRRWKNNTKIYLHEVEWSGMDWVAVA